MLNFVINTKYIFSSELLAKCFSTHIIDKNTNIVQRDVSSMSLTDKINLLKTMGGGIMVSAKIHIINISAILKLCSTFDMCAIKSCINDNSIFDGIIMVAPNVTDELNITSPRHKILTETICGNKSTIYDGDVVIAEHYYMATTILEELAVTVPRCTNTIGITVTIPNTLNDFYSNGIKQNCLYLYELLTSIGYNVKLIIDDESLTNVPVLNGIDFYHFNYVALSNIFNCDLDVVFSMGFSVPPFMIKSLKNIGVKVVYYMCGNNYLIDSERILYDQHKKRDINYSTETFYDEIWIIPQMYNQNKYYCETLCRTKCIQVPFIWSPMSIKFMQKILGKTERELMYRKKQSKIGIFEPNISVMKWALPCVLIAENTHRTYKNISHVYVTNLNKTAACNDINQFNMGQFNKVCSSLDLFKEKKLTAESRYNILDMMSNHCDIAISHQWENPLNYLYLDLAWMGYPILHNAALCKDIGYYYEGFNYHDAAELLNNIILHHETSAETYLRKNRELINKYIPSNLELQNKYRELITNIA